jgi:hypothetical protein
MIEETDDLQKLIEDHEKSKISIQSNNLELSSDATMFTLSLKIKEFQDEKDFLKFVKSCVRIIRVTPEYRLWTDYIKDVLGVYQCAVTEELTSQVTIELHHHPFNMFMINKLVINQYLASGKEFCCLDIVQKVLELHYENKVGYIPLVSTLHEKYHNGFLNLPMELVNGNWKFLLDNYSLEEDDLKNIQEKISVDKNNCGWWKTGGYSWKNNSYRAFDNQAKAVNSE